MFYNVQIHFSPAGKARAWQPVLWSNFTELKTVNPSPLTQTQSEGSVYSGPALGTRSSKVAIVNKREELLLFALTINVLISFLDDMIKLSVKKTKWTILLARTRALKVNGTFEKRAQVKRRNSHAWAELNYSTSVIMRRTLNFLIWFSQVDTLIITEKCGKWVGFG